ncbi:mannose-1-phosphate guanyltransferase alpha-A [Anthonomus grandis grandis]|uniref:mannose-1-phosphate guanyltransferase alpha-A n=1 Tax=Anthonomus grandis grandis TaxID=2921223 RepID=UPI0021651A48|nr:mannose-1-phosphate guanyltransferase alpha-A [Anthonomus grandis grandis]
MLKSVILIGGPLKGTRFRPLSLDIPKPLFPVAGLPVIQHHIEACSSIKELKEILIIGSYPVSQLQQFVNDMQLQYNVTIKYLQEFTALGTAGGLYHFRDQIRSGSPKAFFVLNGDVCADFPLRELYDFFDERSAECLVAVMSTEATRPQSLNFGCMVTDKNTNEITHYVEKPSSYVSTLINCGIYVFSLKIFNIIGEAFNSKQEEYYKNGNGNPNKDTGYLQLEQDILTPLAGSGKMFALQTSKWWSQLKTASSAIYANRHYLELYREKHPERLATGKMTETCTIIPDVHIDPTAVIHPTAVIGPNVSIGAGAQIGAGVRIRESIILDTAVIEERSLIIHSIIGRNSRVGKWARVEGTPCDPDPNKPFAKMENPRLFNTDGRLNPSITILGCSVSVPSETILLNSIVLPNKELSRSIKNEIIL